MGAGRPTDFREEYIEQGRKLALLGLTDKEMADVWGTSEQTFNAWKTAHPEFLESINAGKAIADAEVARSLYERACGYEHDDIELKVVSEGQGAGSRVEEVPVRKYYPPDPTSMIFWLKNRQRKKWRDKIETGFTDTEGNDTNPVIISLPSNGRETTRPDDKAPTGVPIEGTQ